MSRPSKYSSAMCETVIACGDEGMSRAEMARELDIHHSTFAAWQAEKPEFSAAVKEALARSQAWWEKQGRIATFGGVDGYNATSYIFQMKNRFREDWNDKTQTEVSGKLETVETGAGASKVLAMIEAIAERSGTSGPTDAG